MKNIIFVLFIFFSVQLNATTYYVSSSGNDSNSGLTTALAWKTVDKVGTITTFVAGDQILFNRGDTFYGLLKFRCSGLSGNPITYGAYGTGVNPVITGFTTITSGWTNEGNGIYSKVIISSAQTNMVTIDDVQYGMGRYPDSGYMTYESAISNTSITDNDLPDSPNWTGAEAVIRKNSFTIDRTLITSHTTGGVLTYTSLGSTELGRAGYGYFIQNDLKCLTTYGEWYHDYSGTGKFYMYFGAVDPTTKTVNVATLTNTVYNPYSTDYIKLDGLTINGSIEDLISIYSGADYHTIKNCNLEFAGLTGVKFSSNYNVLDANTISNCNKMGISTTGSYNEIKNNNVLDIGLLVGGSPFETFNYGVYSSGTSFFVHHNIIKNIGGDGITTASGSLNGVIQNNLVDSTMLILHDGGGIYMGATHTNLLIDGNIVLNCIGNLQGTIYSAQTPFAARGIYNDDGCNGVTVSNNTISGCNGAGVMVHRSHDITIQNNTSYNNFKGISFENYLSSAQIYNIVLTGNKFVAKTVDQYAMTFYNSTTNDMTSFGTASNNYYARPLDDSTPIVTEQPNTGSVNRSVSSWQSFTGQDSGSKGSPFSITNTSDFRFEYNATSSPITIPLDQNYRTIENTKDYTSVTLQPYTSIVLIKHSAFVVKRGISAGNGKAWGIPGVVVYGL